MADETPAFPVPAEAWDFTGVQTGMTLRDWFAGQALAGLAVTTPRFMAVDAYAIADAMLAERSK